MNIFHLAVASIVDANTGNGLVHANGTRDYAAVEHYGRKIRAKSIAALFADVKSRITASIASYRASAKQHRDLRTLMDLNDHLLEDIGLHRGDLYAVQLGATSLDELNISHQSDNLGELAQLENIPAADRVNRKLVASNEQWFDQKKCA
ncbi:MAG: DUF1127 domain-containing protein [Gammaproteobacteria bacterium]|nr:DUF1127 domain-containing protein [Gammaproteobacteria bacterium]